MRMEVKAVRDGAMTGKLHWYGSGGTLVMTARMTGRVVDPDQVSFQWQAADIEFGGGFAPTAYGVTINPVDGGLRGTWGALGGPLTGGSFSLERLP